MNNISTTIKTEELKQFEQLNSLPFRVLEYVAKQVAMEHFSAGSDLVKPEESTLPIWCEWIEGQDQGGGKTQPTTDPQPPTRWQ